MKNKHGVEMTWIGEQRIPTICTACHNLERESDGEGGIAFVYCIWNHWLPTRKGTCKRYNNGQSQETDTTK